MPVSTPGSGTPSTPSTPPNAITSGKTTGSSQIAGGPRNAPHMPDRDHRDDVIRAEDRVQEAAREAAGHALAGVRERRRRGEHQGRRQSQTPLVA